jgi:FkbM family methyltransferase
MSRRGVLRRIGRRAARMLRPRFASPTPHHHRWLRDRIWEGEYDRPGFVPRQGDVVVDVGANVGVFAVRSAMRGATVRAYEPHPGTFGYLVRNAKRRRIECHQAAVMPEAGTTRLFLDPDYDTRHSTLGHEQRTGVELRDYVEVPTVTLADAIGDGCDLLKVDCEGVEFDLLSATPSERLRRARRIVAELHGESERMRDFAARLESEGYDVITEPLEHERLAMCFAALRESR